jgi:hypothetical protein
MFVLLLVFVAGTYGKLSSSKPEDLANEAQKVAPKLLPVKRSNSQSKKNLPKVELQKRRRQKKIRYPTRGVLEKKPQAADRP